MQICLKCGMDSATSPDDIYAACEHCGAVFFKVKAFHERKMEAQTDQDLNGQTRQKQPSLGRRILQEIALVLDVLATFIGFIFKPFFKLSEKYGFDQSLAERASKRDKNGAKKLDLMVLKFIILFFTAGMALMIGFAKHKPRGWSGYSNRGRSSRSGRRWSGDGYNPDSDGDGE